MSPFYLVSNKDNLTHRITSNIEQISMNISAKIKSIVIISTFLTFSIINKSHAWAQNGHRVVGQIAENHLTDKTKMAIAHLLEGDKLPEVTTWADEMRSDPSKFWKKESVIWHYININEAEDFKPNRYRITATKGEVTDAYSAILKSIAVLQSEQTSLDKKRFYFRFLTHVVGDIHQPMHVGRKDDRGGNDVKVKYFNKDTNLHSLWDKDLLEGENLSFSEYAYFIDTTNKELISQYLASEPKDWVLESFHIAKKLYEVDDGNFSYSYVYEQKNTMNTRLLQGGIRLAGLLNAIFDPSAIPLVQALKLSQTNEVNN